MLTKIKNRLIGSEEKKRLTTNIVYLSILQGSNYILPLLTVPYLVRILGPDYFGLLAFANAIIMYFILIGDYGFNLSATRQISIHRDNKIKINEIFSSVMIIKFALMMVSFLLMSLLVFSNEKFTQHWLVYFSTFGIVVGQVFFPIWFFQGMEKMKYITYLNISSKTFFTVCIFIFVQEKNDYILVPILTSIGFISAGLLSLFLVKKDFQIKFNFQTKEDLKFQLTEGWHVFSSNIATSFYTISTTLILGLFTNNTIVGYFAAADKVIQAVKGLYQPVSQAIYPMIGKKLNVDKKLGLAFIKKITRILGLLMFIISTTLFFLAEPIVRILFGYQYHSAVVIIEILAYVPFIISLSNMYGIQTMLNLGYQHIFTRILFVAAILGVALSLILVPAYAEIGTSITILIVEVFVTITMYGYLKSKGL